MAQIKYATKTKMAFHNSQHFAEFCRYGDRPQDNRKRQVSVLLKRLEDALNGSQTYFWATLADQTDRYLATHAHWEISECAKWGGTNMGATIIYFAMQSQKQKANSRWAGRKFRLMLLWMRSVKRERTRERESTSPRFSGGQPSGCRALKKRRDCIIFLCV